MDDFDLARKSSFVENITQKVSAALGISKVENDRYRYTGIDIKKIENRIEISMDDYGETLQEIVIREDRSEEILTTD